MHRHPHHGAGGWHSSGSRHPLARRLPALLLSLAALVWLALPAAVALAAPPFQATGQSGQAAPGGQGSGSDVIQLDESQAQATFGSDTREIRFLLRAHSASPTDRIAKVQLLYYVDDSVVQNVATPTFQPGTTVQATYAWRVAGLLLPGSEVKFQWQVETAGGRRITTPAQTVSFADQRFTWQQAQGNGFTLYWQGSDPQVGSTLSDEAQKALNRLRADFSLAPETPLRIYAYGRVQDYTSAVASGVVQVDSSMTVPPDRIFLLAQPGSAALQSAAQALRHEVVVAVYSQKTDNPYGPPPQWLTLGFMYYASGETISDSNFKALTQYAGADRLLALRTLNGTFPTSGEARSLANVQSLSAVKFMYDTYGADKVKAVLAAFKDGSTVDDALKKGLGVTLDQFESRWKSALKNGSAARANTRSNSGTAANGRPGAAASGAPATSLDNGCPLDTLFAGPIDYWRGVVGPSAVWVVPAVAGFIGLGFIAVVGGSAVAAVRRARREHDEY